jgi:hypothetical protein
MIIGVTKNRAARKCRFRRGSNLNQYETYFGRTRWEDRRDDETRSWRVTERARDKFTETQVLIDALRPRKRRDLSLWSIHPSNTVEKPSV